MGERSQADAVGAQPRDLVSERRCVLALPGEGGVVDDEGPRRVGVLEPASEGDAAPGGLAGTVEIVAEMADGLGEAVGSKLRGVSAVPIPDKNRARTSFVGANGVALAAVSLLDRRPRRPSARSSANPMRADRCYQNGTNVTVTARPIRRKLLVPKVGLEPTRVLPHRILSP